MNVSRLEKLAPLSGVLAMALMLAGTMLIGWTYLPTPDEALKIFSDDPNKVITGAFIGMPSAFFLIWFAGSVTVLGLVSLLGAATLSARTRN